MLKEGTEARGATIDRQKPPRRSKKDIEVGEEAEGEPAEAADGQRAEPPPLISHWFPTGSLTTPRTLNRARFPFDSSTTAYALQDRRKSAPERHSPSWERPWTKWTPASTPSTNAMTKLS